MLRHGRWYSRRSMQKWFPNNRGNERLFSRDTRMTNNVRNTSTTIHGKSKTNILLFSSCTPRCQLACSFLKAITKRYATTTTIQKKPKSRSGPKKKDGATTSTTTGSTTTTTKRRKIEVDEDGEEIPCFENGFGYVYYKPRLGHEEGLYGVGSFGCSYDRHPDDPPNDSLDLSEIETLIEQRVHCKLVHDFEMADTIEDELKVMHGVYLDNARSIWTTRLELVATKEELLNSTVANKNHQVFLDSSLNRRRGR